MTCTPFFVDAVGIDGSPGRSHYSGSQMNPVTHDWCNMKLIKFVLLVLAFMLPSKACRSDALPPSIQLPTRTVVKETRPTPGTVTTTEIIDTIEPGVWYVIRSQDPLFVLDSPRGAVSIISGATSIDGVFAGGDGKPETRVFDPEESTYLIQGLRPCKCELILIPVGVMERNAIFRQMLTVTGPNPPPDPPSPDPDPPGPAPDPPGPTPGPVVVKTFRVIFVKESGDTLNPQQTAIPGAKAIRDWVAAKSTIEPGQIGPLEFDPQQDTSNLSPAIQELWRTVLPKLKPAPCMVVEVNNHCTVLSFPADVAECLATLKQYRRE